MSNHIVFRAAPDLAAAIASRTRATSHNLTAQRDLERYYALLAAELRTVSLTAAEALLLADALNGTLWEPHTMRLLWANVDDAIRLDGLADKWQVIGAALVAKLRALTSGQTIALVDAIERAWQADGDMRERLVKVGLLKPEPA